MYILEEACKDASFAATILFSKKLIDIIFIIGPILLILLLTIDFSKAVMANDDNRIKQLRDTAIKRILFAVALFFVPLIADTAFSLLDNGKGNVISCYNKVDNSYVDSLAKKLEADIKEKETQKQRDLQIKKALQASEAAKREKLRKAAAERPNSSTSSGSNSANVSVPTQYVQAKRIAEAVSGGVCTSRNAGHCTLGDQGSGKNGNEVRFSKWSGGWDYIWRPADPVVANKAALCMEKAVRNNNIGYGRSGGYPYNWESLWNYMKKRKDWDPETVNKKINVSCCPMVAVCLKYAGYKPTSDLGCQSNANMKRDLKKSGKFIQIYPGKKQNITNIKRGDVVFLQFGGGVHMAMAV